MLQINALNNAVMAGFKPPIKQTVSEWADENRQLSPESAAEPGRWRTSRAEYQRGMMDVVNDSEINVIVIMKSSQIGATEIINNTLGYMIAQDPAPILVVQPTLEMSRAYSKDRFSTMVRDTQKLQGLIRAPRSKNSENTILHKTFPGGHITIAGANSPSSLASRPIRFLFCDEVDRYPASAGSEGDPIALAQKRLITYWNRKQILASTPTIKNLSRIESAFDESDKRYFYIPCPACKTAQRLYWKNVTWQKGDQGEHLPETAGYQCEACVHIWTDEERRDAISAGEWRATAKTNSKIAGFHIWSAYSPWVSLAEIVDEFLKVKDDPERLKAFVNTILGESWEDEGQQVDSDDLYTTRREEYAADIPAGGLVLTAGIDVQADRIEGEIVAWGVGEESWSVDYFIIPGDPARPEPWRDLDEKLTRLYTHEFEVTMKVAAAFIDSGYHADQVYKFVRGKEGRRIFASKGSNTPARPLVGARPTKTNKGKVHLYLIGTDTGKESIMHRLQIDTAGPGYMHFPNRYDPEYFSQLTAEKAVIKYRFGHPRRVWIKTRERNEALDCRVLNLAILRWLNVDFKKIERKVEKAAAEMDGIADDVNANANAQTLAALRRRGFANWKN